MATSETKKKCFNDPIHKHIELQSLLVKVINTPQFQRLRNIKQLGGNYFLYPGASHNRFEHSIGTCHLAGELIRHLQLNQPKLDIDDKDVLCVELAGLCHDLGHGPFSHMFDHLFLEKIGNETQKPCWKHEERSCRMFNQILTDNPDIASDFKELLQTEDDKKKKAEITKCQNAIFIKEMINGPRPDDKLVEYKPQPAEWQYEGRPREKGFLYEIVANKRNGVDVDKWDYFARDCHQLGIANSFDHIRFMKNTRVLDYAKITAAQGQDGGNGQAKSTSLPDLGICARDKECKNLYEMFHTRVSLYHRAYQHRISTAVEAMICDAMVLANNCIKFKGNEENKKMAQSVDDMVAFEQITDNVMQQIYYSSDSSLEMIQARQILKRVFTHDYYHYLGIKKVPKSIYGVVPADLQKEIDGWKDKQKTSFKEKFEGLEEHVVYREKKYDYGRKAQNPVDLFGFYAKNEPDIPITMKREEVSHLLPQQFLEYELEVYYKGKVDDKHYNDVDEKFRNWMEQE